MSKLDLFSKKAFHYFLHCVMAMLLINWVIVTPAFHGIGIYEIVLFLLGCSALLRLYYEKGGVFKAIFQVMGSAKWSVVAITVYLVLGAVNILYSQSPTYALEKYITVVQLLFVGACMLYHIADRPNAQRGLYLNMGLTTILIAFFALGKYLFFTDGDYPAIITPMRDYNLYSTILLMGWICAITYSAQLSVSNMQKCTLITIFTGILMPMVQVSGSRRSYLISFGVAAFVLAYAIILTVKTIRANKKAYMRAVCILLACVLCVGLANVAMTKTVSGLAQKESSGPADGPGPSSAQDRLEIDSGFGKRIFIWNAAVKEIQRYDTKTLLFGKGAAYSSDLYDDTSIPEVQIVHDSYNKSAENPAKKNWMNPHNLLLQDMLDGGIFLLLSLLTVIGAAVFYSVRLIRQMPAVGIGISLMYTVLLFTLLLSSGKGMLVNKFFWLITFMQLLECFRIKYKKGV